MKLIKPAHRFIEADSAQITGTDESGIYISLFVSEELKQAKVFQRYYRYDSAKGLYIGSRPSIAYNLDQAERAYKAMGQYVHTARSNGLS